MIGPTERDHEAARAWTKAWLGKKQRREAADALADLLAMARAEGRTEAAAAPSTSSGRVEPSGPAAAASDN